MVRFSVVILLVIIVVQLQTIILHIEGARLDWLDLTEVPECVITEQPLTPPPSTTDAGTYL